MKKILMKGRRLHVLITMAVVFFTIACPRPRSQSTTIEVQTNPNRIVIRHTINWFASASELSNQTGSEFGKGILDLANPWQPVNDYSSYVEIKVRKENGQLVASTFPLLLTNGAVSSVDKDTTPYFYQLEDEQSVANFINEETLGQSENEIQVDFVFAVEQVDCSISTGSYTSHLRHYSSSGITYYESVTLLYSVPDNIQGENRCEQATITLK